MGIFDFLKNLFRRKAGTQPSLTPTAQHISLQEPLPPRPTPPRSISSYGNGPLRELLNQVRGKGHPEYPFLHQTYSPGSRIPCVDFTPFIIERLAAGDVGSICLLMREIIAANPGIGTQGEWIEEEVEKTIRAPLENYLCFADPDVYRQLRAMWIIAAKSGGGREFWLTNDSPLHFAQVLSPYDLELLPAMEELCEKANRFIREMRKDTPYWLDFPLFKSTELTVPPLPAGECVSRVRLLSIGTRLHLFFAVRVGGGMLPRLTDYELRSFGLFIPDSSAEIIESWLLSPCQDPDILRNSMSKTELFEACDQAAVPYKKSWNKEKLLQALTSISPEHVDKLIADSQLVMVNPEYAECLKALLARSQQLEAVFKVLCFT